MTDLGQLLRAGTIWIKRVWDRSFGRLLSAILIGLIRGYQRFVSPLTPPSCRYHPSCSAYALAAVRCHGPVKGFLLATWRLLRCNPWSRGGIDFPPQRGGWRGDHQVRPTTAPGQPGSGPEQPGDGTQDRPLHMSHQVVSDWNHRK